MLQNKVIIQLKGIPSKTGHKSYIIGLVDLADSLSNLQQQDVVAMLIYIL
jgi:hypothetical protein